MDTLSIATALIGGAVPLVRTALDILRQRKRESALAKESFEEILSSADLKTLGKYLDDQLGAVNVGRYARKPDARDRVDRALSRLEEFLGTDDVAEYTSAGAGAEVGPYATAIHGLPVDVTDRLNSGDDWGALVRLRIALEQATTAALERRGLGVQSRMPFRQRLDLLVKLQAIDEDAVGSAMTARGIANRAAHGQPVTAEELSAALRAGSYALGSLQQNVTP